RPALDGLRGLAIIGVFAHHAQVPFLAGGFIGVDVFFVLSGFLITALLLQEAEETRRISLRSFYVRRALRLLPALAVLLGALVLASLPSLGVLRGRGFRAIALAAALVLGVAMHVGRIDAHAMYFGIGTLVSLCAALVVIATVAAEGGIASLLEFGPLVWIGRISYGLYLWHYPVVVGLFDSHRLARLGVDPVWWIPMQIGASLAIATASFYLLERP